MCICSQVDGGMSRGGAPSTYRVGGGAKERGVAGQTGPPLLPQHHPPPQDLRLGPEPLQGLPLHLILYIQCNIQVRGYNTHKIHYYTTLYRNYNFNSKIGCLILCTLIQAQGLQFRHTDNINHWRNAMVQVGLPTVIHLMISHHL